MYRAELFHKMEVFGVLQWDMVTLEDVRHDGSIAISCEVISQPKLNIRINNTWKKH